MRYPIINHWSAETMKQAILQFNNGRRATVSDTNICTYMADDGNRCYVGCFIPNTHPALRKSADTGGVAFLLSHYPGLGASLPLGEDGLYALQNHHDYYFGDEDMAARACRWIDEHCYDVFD